ncbi:MAG: tetratricopeptide repeat protein, partial [Crocinitomicaceae bacterium]|nr:tetratricopeptide repeat protein [Crocinitomicaceae bacterium]
MKLLTLTILFLISEVIYGQDSYVDSREKILKGKIHDTLRTRIYIELAEYIGDESEWMRYNKLALNLANDKLQMAGGAERKMYLTVKANAVGNVGYYYDDHGNKKESLKNYFEALRIYDKANDEAGKASILGNIGVVFTDQGDYDEAMDYLSKALKIKQKYYPDDVAKNYLNLGVVTESLGDTTSAVNYYKQALITAKKVDNKTDMATAYNNIGTSFFNRKKYKQSIFYLRLAIHNYRANNDEPGEAWAMGNIGSSFLNIGEIDSCFLYTTQAMEISDRLGYPELIQSISEKLARVYSSKKDYQNSLKYYLISVKMTDSLNNVEVQKEALRQKLLFDHDLEKATIADKRKKELEIEKNRRETAQHKRREEKKRDSQRVLYISIGMIMAVVFGIIIYNRLRITKKQKLTIEDQKLKVETQKGLLEEKNKEIVDSINYAKRLQEAILPDKTTISDYFNDAFLLYLPKDIVAGDFFWKHELNPNELLIAAADCTGHGVPGALVSVVCANALDRATKEFELSTTGKILDKVTELVIDRLDQGLEGVKDGMDIALCKVNLKSGSVEFSGANNPLWIIRKGAEEVKVIKGDRQPVGKFDGLKEFKSETTTLSDGDWIYLFSDGYSDQFGGEKGKKYKSANLKKFLLNGSMNTG